MTTDDVYDRLIAWYDQTWYGLPASEHRRPMLMAFFTPEEAELLIELPWTGASLEELARSLGRDLDGLEASLEALARRGVVWRTPKGGQIRYRPNDAFLIFYRSAFWPGRTDEVSRATALFMDRYHLDHFMDPFAPATNRGLRAVPARQTLPVNRTPEDNRQVQPYEDVAALLEGQDYFCVSSCACRHRKNLATEKPCSHPVEVCLHFGTLARYMTTNGLGREISREEAREVLDRAADSGLVHAVSNWRAGADTICNCCRCCCLFIESHHVLGHARSHDPSNYLLAIEPTTCQACGLCVKRCPMEALELVADPGATNKKGQAPALAAERCLGCGVCVHKCPSESLRLVERETRTEPPADPRDWMRRFQTDRTRAGS